MLTSKLLTKKEAFKLWVFFAHCIGNKTLHEVFGEYWPRLPLKDELVWGWYCDDDIVGWVAIRHDPLEPVMWAVIGVFPQYQNVGYSREIFDKTIAEGFKIYKDVEWVFASISKKNPKYFDHMKNNACRWIQVGEINVPEPGYTIFALSRDRFNG